jgi:hypothetical protein
MILAYIWYKKAFKNNDFVFNEYTFDQNLDIINFDLGFLLKKLFLNKIEKIIIYLQLELIKYNYESFQEIFNSYNKKLLKTRLKIINKVIIKRLKLSKNINLVADDDDDKWVHDDNNDYDYDGWDE